MKRKIPKKNIIVASLWLDFVILLILLVAMHEFDNAYNMKGHNLVDVTFSGEALNSDELHMIAMKMLFTGALFVVINGIITMRLLI